MCQPYFPQSSKSSSGLLDSGFHIQFERLQTCKSVRGTVSLHYARPVTQQFFTNDVMLFSPIRYSVTTHLWRRLGERMYSSYSFATSALDGGEWSASHPGRALPPEKGPPVPIVQEAGWASEPVWTQRLEEKSLPLPGIEPHSPGRPVCS
jgi:hypothetical protein